MVSGFPLLPLILLTHRTGPRPCLQIIILILIHYFQYFDRGILLIVGLQLTILKRSKGKIYLLVADGGHLFTSTAETSADLLLLFTNSTVLTRRSDGALVIYDNVQLLYNDLLLLNNVLVEAAVLLHKPGQLLHLEVPLPVGVPCISLHGNIIQNFLYRFDFI